MGGAGSCALNTESERHLFREIEKQYNEVKKDGGGSDQIALKAVNKCLRDVLTKLEKSLDSPKLQKKKDKERRGVMFSESIAVGKKDKIFEMKEYPKTESEMEILLMSIRKNFLFTTLSNKEKTNLAKAMRCQIFKEGSTIIQQGDTGDDFYVIEEGCVDVVVDGKVVGKLHESGSFGELALLYNCPRAASVSATVECKMWLLDRMTFRHAVAMSSSDEIADVISSLESVKMLEQLEEGQIRQIAGVVKIMHVEKGDKIVEKGDAGDTFFMIKDGEFLVSGAKSGSTTFEDITLRGGECFGERALLTNEPRAATVTASTPGVVMALDRHAFTELLGPLHDVLASNLGRQVLRGVPLLKSVSEDDKEKIVDAFRLVYFKAGAYMIKQDDMGDTFFIIKEGNATVTVNGKEGGSVEVAQMTRGSFFGEGGLLKNETRKANVIATTSCECFSITRDEFNAVLGPLQDIIEKDILETKAQRDKEIASLGVNETNGVLEKDVCIDDFEFVSILGCGTFGKVRLVRHKELQKSFAMKCLRKSVIIAMRQEQNILNEKEILSETQHPFVLDLLGTFKDEVHIYMCLELVLGGELFSYLSNAGLVPSDHAKFYAACVVSVFEYLHGLKIVYRDLKPENLLIDEIGYIKVVDFGFAKKISDRTYTLCGTPEYLSPEIIIGKGHNAAVDYWALGILIFEMLCGYTPFAVESTDQMYVCRNIVSSEVEWPIDVSYNCEDLVTRLLNKDMARRLGCLKGGCKDIKKHAWFAGLDWKILKEKKFEAPWIPEIVDEFDCSNFDEYDDDDMDEDDDYVDDPSRWERF